MDVKLEESWKTLLKDEFDKEYFKYLTTFVREQYKTKKIYPPASLIFNALNLCSFDNVKVVILGQDPYHGYNQANGLSFSVNDGIPIPPSLQNIYKEIKSDIGVTVPKSGNLQRWAKQGVLLLNATLTVQAGIANSHQGYGWEEFTDAIVKVVSEQKEHVVFILWGSYAQKKGAVIDESKHLILNSPHPSPFSADRGFFGSKPFSKTNEYLTKHKLNPINW
ncbi:MAG: Uracil-DNA glycosylase [candidate division WS6 bacterium GW2011_GWF2_39_15]|uniref:Uracil-DNA glycosylase n=1 Tax=candidate division WS6 bacterium GW2011_GWF2_39_15 TaxID=1619100 RepID=A0A0G0QWH0_9BACT|nr:MAG: Uracil-DNA glycosylase [candidate division WS6 bacterium GW2011_GWF2_39_15]